jgi:nitrile hydratase
MNGMHDLGGMHGFGPIEPRLNEEVFHAEWEKRVPGLTSVATRTGTTGDQMRHGIERMPPERYLTASYYERHLFTTELNLVERGVLTPDEIEARVELLGLTRPRRAAAIRRGHATIRARLSRAYLVRSSGARFQPATGRDAQRPRASYATRAAPAGSGRIHLFRASRRCPT